MKAAFLSGEVKMAFFIGVGIFFGLYFLLWVCMYRYEKGRCQACHRRNPLVTKQVLQNRGLCDNCEEDSIFGWGG